MNIKVLMITFNRPEYTRLSLQRLCDTAPDNLKVTIWDNASDRETKAIVAEFEGHPAVERVIYNRENEKLRRPTNWFYENSPDADLLGKVDDDCLVPQSWSKVLERAHADIPEAGILGCWRFFPEDFNPDKARKKIKTYGNHQVMRNCWIEGSGYLMKREVIQKIGYIGPKDTFTDYCLRAAARGYIVGWYYPFLYQEHMDDPRSAHTGIRTEADFQRLIPLSALKFGVTTKEQWGQRLKTSAQRLQEYSIDPYDFIGLRAKVKRNLLKLVGGDFFPKVR